jgi:biopolymer transport protein ExbD
MGRRHKKKRGSDEVELNLAAMLDMAFQLLAFFILTFKPPAVEGQILLRMPPPQSMVPIKGGRDAGENEKDTNPLKGLDTLTIQVFAKDDGTIHSIQVANRPAMGNNMSRLDDSLRELIGDPKAIFTQVLINVHPKLHYDSLMNVVDICTRQKLPDGTRLGKLSFVEMGL